MKSTFSICARSVSGLLALWLAVTGCRNREDRASTLQKAIEESQRNEISDLRRTAEDGDVIAQYKLGEKYYSGQDLPKDFTQAAKWFRKAAEQGYAPAQCNLSILLISG